MSKAQELSIFVFVVKYSYITFIMYLYYTQQLLVLVLVLQCLILNTSVCSRGMKTRCVINIHV